jgi:AcrR family transcriptional regulator
VTAARRPPVAVPVLPAASSGAGAPVRAVDPRVLRTRAHVLSHAGRLLAEGGAEALTFSRLSAEARVSRQTLYRYWASPAALAVDLVRDRVAPDHRVTGAPEQAVLAFLTELRERLEEPGVSAAYSMLLSATEQHPEAVGVLDGVLDETHRIVGRLVAGSIGDLDRSDFDLLVGPVLYSHFVARRPLSDRALARAVQHLFAGR